VDASRGGFGRFDGELARFILQVERDSELPLDPVYTAKALLALRASIDAGEWDAGSRLVFIHTGGLQGRRAAQEQLLRLRG